MRNINAILREDTKRRNARQVMEDAILGLGLRVVDESSDAYKIEHNRVKGARVNPCLVRGIGTVNPPANTSASDNCWNRGMKGKTTGVATGTELTHKLGDPATVRVIKGGSSEVVPVSHFRRNGRTTSRKIKSTTVVPETALHSPKLAHDFTS